MNCAVKASNVSYSVEKNDNVIHILNGVDFEIETGKMVAVSGPSGSGKTTLLYGLAGLLELSAGSVSLFGEDIYGLKQAPREKYRLENISIVYQNLNLMPFLDVNENVCLPLLLKSKTVTPDKQRYIDRLLDTVGLQSAKHKAIANLSGGEQQRVSIVRALAADAKLLLADEPTGNLDRENTKIFLEHLSAVVRENKVTTVIITHDEYVAQYCDYTIRIQDGRVV